MKWPTVRLSGEVTIKGGGTPSRQRLEFFQGDIPWATIKDLTGLYLEHTQEHITKEALESSAANLIPAGNVILATRVGLGKVALNTIDVAINQDLKALFCSSRLDPKYLVYYLTSLADSIERQGVGATVKGITLKQVENWPLPLPPPSEQRRIVKILDQADALRKKRAEADPKAERILLALFVKMFGDPVTNPKGWETTTLSGGGAIIRYGLGQPPKASLNGIPLIRATNIRRGTITDQDMMFVCRADVPESRNAFLSADEVIVVRSGAYTGDVAQITERWTGSVAGYDLVVTPGEHFCGEYIEAYLLTPHVQKNYFGNMKARAGQPHLNASQLSATPILCPPKNLQLRFADQVQSVRHLQKCRVASKQRLEDLFVVLLHRAFSGELTANWREAHMKELLAEMEEQARALNREKLDSQAQGLLFN